MLAFLRDQVQEHCCEMFQQAGKTGAQALAEAQDERYGPYLPGLGLGKILARLGSTILPIELESVFWATG